MMGCWYIMVLTQTPRLSIPAQRMEERLVLTALGQADPEIHFQLTDKALHPQIYQVR